jgi:predicted TIM-barrel fold metal-dependent hydrolase
MTLIESRRIVEAIPVIDMDTHLIEPPDLWTSRMSKKWGDRVPHLRVDESSGDEWWYSGNTKALPIGAVGFAGFDGHRPGYPKRFVDIDPAAWDAKKRLELMDRYGIAAQVIFSNLTLFSHQAFADEGADPEFVSELIRCYNDYQSEWTSIAPDRLVPLTQLPFFDLEASITEMERCAQMGHRGIVFTQEPGTFGLPPLRHRHWDRLWAAAQDMELSVNFHIGTALDEEFNKENTGKWDDRHDPTRDVTDSIVHFFNNFVTISELITGGICHRFPRLNFVSVESGIGWIPFALESLDWQWKHYDFGDKYDLLPSEYFRRQIYCSFWFEKSSALHALQQLGPDNVMWETDFPHPTSMSPGGPSPALPPDRYIEANFRELPETTLRKVFHDNAARLYGLP